MSRNLFDHYQSCPAAENSCGYGDAAHYIYDRGWACSICGQWCICDIVADERKQAAQRVAQVPIVGKVTARAAQYRIDVIEAAGGEGQDAN